MMKRLDPSAIFRGVVVNNQDPEGRNRCQLQIPQIMGGARSGWAEPIPAVGASRPSVGDQVMVTFEGADLTRPAYFAPMSSALAAQAEADAQRAITLANQAEKDAQRASAQANSAQSIATAAMQNIAAVEGDAQTGIANAATAQSTANQAETDAQTAITNAAKAQTTANQAETDAQTAITNAQKAQTTANQAETDAQTGIANANTAAGMAKAAQNIGSTAQQTAQSALDAANAAQTTASSGKVSTDRITAGTGTFDSSAAKSIATAIPAKTITGSQLTDNALTGKTFGDSGWMTFADAGINFASGFAAYGSTCRFRALNGVAYLTGQIQVTSAMTSGSVGATFTIASWAAGSVAASYLDTGGFNGYVGSFYSGGTNTGAGGINVSCNSRVLQLGYRTVGQLPAGYFAFNASFPYT